MSSLRISRRTRCFERPRTRSLSPSRSILLALFGVLAYLRVADEIGQ